jgi:hypothetical protein
MGNEIEIPYTIACRMQMLPYSCLGVTGWWKPVTGLIIRAAVDSQCVLIHIFASVEPPDPIEHRRGGRAPPVDARGALWHLPFEERP